MKDSPIDSVLQAIKVTGEGRGRLGIEQQNYLFSYEALLNKSHDWILAVEVPLHGEEVMILHQIQNPKPENLNKESFEARIDHELKKRIKAGDLKAETFTGEIRSFLRFVLAADLSIKRVCQKQSDEIFECEMEKEKYSIHVTKDKIRIIKYIGSSHYFELMGENLTESFFGRTNFHLRAQQNKDSLLSLELFWK